VPTDPLTASRYPGLNSSPNIPQDIQNAVWDLADNTIPRFATTTARDAAYAAWIAAGHTLASGMHCTVGGALQVYRNGWKPAGETLVREVDNTAFGTLNGWVNIVAPQTIPASPFGTSVAYVLDVDATARVTIPSGLGAKLELFVNGETTPFGGDEYTNAGSTSCVAVLHARDFITTSNNTANVITAVLTSLAGTVTVSTKYGRLVITARPYRDW
jgi:hypothetical protein